MQKLTNNTTKTPLLESRSRIEELYRQAQSLLQPQPQSAQPSQSSPPLPLAERTEQVFFQILNELDKSPYARRLLSKLRIMTALHNPAKEAYDAALRIIVVASISECPAAKKLLADYVWETINFENNYGRSET